MRKFCVLILFMAVCLGAQGRIKLPAIISDNMVLQQKSNVKLWGWADAGEEVTVVSSWGKAGSAVADASGKWSLQIKTPKHCSGQSLKFLSGSKEEVAVKNILIGEVWLASGQSNMEFWTTPKKGSAWMTGMEGWEKEIEDAEYPDIHLFKVEECWDHTAPHQDCQGKWVVCSKKSVQNYSAVAFLFGRELHKALQRPVGVILCAVGGTHAESWIREKVMRKDSIYNRVFKSYSPDKAAKKGYLHKVPAAVWNGMVNPIVGYTIKGNIWYQAESNAWRSGDYAPIFVDLVDDWRALWGQKRLPFYFMQVAPYGQKVECYGPVFKNMKRVGSNLEITFQNGKGLHFANLLPDNSVAAAEPAAMARYLHIAGENGVFHPALSRIENGRLIVWNPAVAVPVHVKYCTEDYCKGNIYNGAGLPAYPFAK